MTGNSPNLDPFVILTDDRGEPWVQPGSGPGTVYKCRHRQDGGLWALRIVDETPETADFRRLLEILPELRHPSIAAVADTRGMEVPGGISFAVEFCEGGSLADLAAKEGPLPWPVVRWFAMQIADALEYAHARGLPHGVLRPSAIMLAEPWPAAAVKLVDFGLVPGSGEKDSAAAENDDLSALGVVLWWLLAGGDPFAGRADPEIPRDIDPEARRVLLALLGKDPSGRVSGAAALGDLLTDSLLDSLPPPESGETDGPARPAKVRPAKASPKLPWAKIAAALAACLLLIGVPVTLLLRGKDGPSREAEDLAVKKQQAEREQATRELEEKERIEKELQAAREREEKERIAREQQAAREREAREQAMRDEQAAKERAEREQAMMREREEKERIAREQAMREADALVARLEKILEDTESATADKEDAFRQCLELAKKDHPAAAALCGVSYWFGNGIARDPAEAARWFRKGAELGNSRAMLGFGNALESGQGVPMDKKQAVEWWTKAAEQGEPLAMNRLGEHFNSDAGDRDIRLAMDWWQKAAEHDIPEAMTNLGIHHAAGTLGEKSVEKAVALWRKAADLGEPRAMTELGYSIFNGEIEGQAKETAFPLFQKAAEAEDLRAMTGLGVCYLTGTGTPENRGEAEKWLRKAAGLGEPGARKFLESLDER